MKIIVRAPNWIGDAILSFPAMMSLKENFPEAEVWILSRNWIKDLFGNDFPIAGLIPLPESNSWKVLRATSLLVKERSFDVGLLLTNSFSSALLFHLARVPKRWGYSTDGRALFLTSAVRKGEDHDSIHMVDFYNRLLTSLGLKTIVPDIRLTVTPEEKKWANKTLEHSGIDREKPLVLLNPGAFYGPAKRWPAERFARTASILQKDKNAEVAITGSEDETGLAEEVASLMEIKPAVFTGKTTLRQSLALISRAAVFLTNDSGPMHMANALRVPVVTVFGPTNPAVTRPYHQPFAVLKKDAPCWPCFYRKCPYDHRCMTSIEPEEVAAVSEEFL